MTSSADIDALERELLGDDTFNAPPEAFKETRDQYASVLTLFNFNMSRNGPCNYRDGTVLGKNPGIKLPATMVEADRVKLSIWLDCKVEQSMAASVPCPELYNKRLRDAGKAMAHRLDTGVNECWLTPSQLSEGLVVEFKKRSMALSRNYRKLCNEQWPTFVFTAVAYKDDSIMLTVKSQSFEVRSKEQKHQTYSAQGLSASGESKRRRTPEVEMRSERLRALQEQIVTKRGEIQRQRARHNEYWTRLRFIHRILESSQNSDILLRTCKSHIAMLEKWKE